MVRRELRLAVYVGGIYLFYLLFALVQERITKKSFGEGDRFTFTFFMLFIQCGIGTIVAFLASCIFGDNKNVQKTPQVNYFIISCLYLTAMLGSNAALNYIPYPTQCLAKSCKPIPVMIIGFIFLKKKYCWKEWAMVSMIVTGISLFLVKNKESANIVSDSEYWMGISLLLLSLACDGFTGPLQERIFSTSKPSPIRMMMWNNFYATILCGIGAFVVTNQGMDAISFCDKYQEVIYSLLLFSCLGALGQICIFLLVSDFGALACSITTTTRKFFTILTSVIFYGHSLTLQQWSGVVLVFIGLALQMSFSFYKKQAKSHSH